MHVWGIGVSPEERDLGKAYRYFAQGTPGGLEGCADRIAQRKKEAMKKDGTGEEVAICDRHCLNGMGQVFSNPRLPQWDDIFLFHLTIPTT